MGDRLHSVGYEAWRAPIKRRVVVAGATVAGAVAAVAVAAGWDNISSNHSAYDPSMLLSGMGAASVQNGASDNSRQFSIIPPEQAFHLPTDPVQLCAPVDKGREFPLSPDPQWREASAAEVEREDSLAEEAAKLDTEYYRKHSYGTYQTPDGKTHYYEVRQGEDEPNDDFVEMIQVPLGTPLASRNPDGTSKNLVPWEMTVDQVPGDPTARILNGDINCQYPTVTREFVGFAPPTNIPNPLAPRNITPEGTITGSSEFEDPALPTITVQPESIRIS